MRQVIIENPVLNSPFDEPSRHFRFDEEGITNDIVEERRISSYFIPIAQPHRRGRQQLPFDTEWTKDRIEENKVVNRIRQRIGLWREGGYLGVTPTTSRLLEYWTKPERERKLFFCQIEALETAIYIAEVAKKYGDPWIENQLREANDQSNPGLPRMALKMATGSGKTVVMAMLIAWQTLNKLANPQDTRFSDTFLIITPGITIRDRLRVLLPNDPENYYRQRDILPGYLLEQLSQAKVLITNFHAFKLREKVSAGKLTKAILAEGNDGAFTETPDQMVRRVCRELGHKKNIIVFNDEAHHCYRRKPDGEDVKLTGDDRKEAERREEEARVWISGIEAVKRKIGVKSIFDLSATPFFLRGSGYPEGTLFPWVVSDFSLIDAIEAGIVKVPRVPVADDSMTGEQPTYRDLWLRIREDLQKGENHAGPLPEPTLEKYFRDDDGNDKPWLFPQLLGIAKRWLAECVTLKDNTFPQLLLLIEFAHDAADRIYKAIIASTDGTAALKPILRPYDTIGSTRYVDFDTTRPVFATRDDKCHVSHVVADTDSWEQKMAEALEDMPEVIRYVKNHNLSFTIPYTLNGEEKNYIPDFIACIDDGHGPDDLLNLLIEVTGEKKKDKAAKVATARTLWVPAINNHGGFGRWAFIEVADPWDAQNLIRGFLKQARPNR